MNSIFVDAMEYLGLSQSELEQKINIAKSEKMKIWHDLNPQNISQLTEYYKNNEMSFFDILDFNTWSNAQIPIYDFSKLDIKTCLDFGCGCGSTALHLAKQGYEVSICDLNNLMTEFTLFRLQKYGFDAHIVDLSELKPLKTNYDLITTIDVLEHVFNPLELIIHFREYSKYWYSTALKPKPMPEHLGLWKDETIIDIIKSIGWSPLWLASDEGRGFFQ